MAASAVSYLLVTTILFLTIFFCLSSFYWRPRISTPEIILYFSLQHSLPLEWSPIPVLTLAQVAYLQWSYGNWCFQLYIAVATILDSIQCHLSQWKVIFNLHRLCWKCSLWHSLSRVAKPLHFGRFASRPKGGSPGSAKLPRRMLLENGFFYYSWTTNFVTS